ncbi:MAG: hypothetical protein ACE5GM_00065 [bacterium]
MHKKGVTVFIACLAVASLSLGGTGCSKSPEEERAEIAGSLGKYAKTAFLPNAHDHSGIGEVSATKEDEVHEGTTLSQSGPEVEEKIPGAEGEE